MSCPRPSEMTLVVIPGRICGKRILRMAVNGVAPIPEMKFART